MALGDMEQLDVQSKAWHRVSTKLSVERSYQCSLPLARDHILVTGGYSWNSIIGKTESLNLTSKDAGNWKMLSNLNTPRYLHACSSILLKNNKLGAIVAGGYSDKYLNSTEIYFPEENSWKPAGSTMYPRQGAQIAVLGGRPTVLGGFHDYDQYPDMVEQFDVDSGFWFPLKQKLQKGRRYFGLAHVPETLFPQCL